MYLVWDIPGGFIMTEECLDFSPWKLIAMKTNPGGISTKRSKNYNGAQNISEATGALE